MGSFRTVCTATLCASKTSIALPFLQLLTVQSMDEEIRSPLVSTASQVTCELCPFIVSATSPFFADPRGK
jgi:branched-subunit amino acid permease